MNWRARGQVELKSRKDGTCTGNSSEWMNRILATARLSAVAMLLSAIAATPLAGQTPALAPVTRQVPQSLAEMSAAGLQMAFDVASVKSNLSDAPPTSRFPLGPGDAYAPGNLFSATNQPLIAYLRFAFKLGQSDLLGLPAWVYNDRFDVQARADGTPTKDQMRLMMQSLLTDRFMLITHTEQQTKPTFNLLLAKAGRTGPQLQASDDRACSAAATPQATNPGSPAVPSAPSSTSGLQLPSIPCASIGPIPASAPNRGRLGGRSVTLERLADFLMNPFTGVDRPVRDRTGLTGSFDFSVEWVVPTDPAQATPRVEDTEPTFLQALDEQLGLRLQAAAGPVNVLVIDRVEHPSPN